MFILVPNHVHVARRVDWASGPFAARFAVLLGPQNRGALSAKEHAGTRQSVTVFMRHASQVYSQYDPID